jgi:hypothetical protein
MPQLQTKMARNKMRRKKQTKGTLRAKDIQYLSVPSENYQPVVEIPFIKLQTFILKSRKI